MGEFTDSVREAHLKRISDYILPGQGIWWKKNGNFIEFLDCDEEVDNHPEGPSMMTFQSCEITEVREIE